jgi:VWFA-related protein
MFLLKRISALVGGVSLALVSLGGSAPPATAESPQPASGTADELAFGEVVEIQLVNVDLWVSDRRGQPVAGLTASDFEVLEDGQPVEVTHFDEIRSQSPLARAEGATSSPPAVPATPGGGFEAPGAHLVLYFDEARLAPNGRKRLVADLREFVASGAVPAAQTLILRQTDLLSIEAPFGSTAAELDEALARLTPPLPLGALTAQELRLAVRRLQDLWTEAQSRPSGGAGGSVGPAACQFFVPRAVPEVERAAERTTRRSFTTLDHLTSVASFLSGLPGVKTVVYLGNGLETQPGAGLMAFVEDLCPGSNETTSFALVNRELSESMRTLTRHANTNQVTIYAPQTGGLQTSFLGLAEQESVDFRGSRRFETVLRNNARGGLSYLAGETGGRAIFDTNRFGAEFAQIGREMSNYYSLAYEPPHGGDGREHRIEIRIDADANFRVRHRRGYRDKNTGARMAERLEGALFLGLVSNPLGARLGAGDLSDSGGGSFTLPLHVLVPIESMTFLDPPPGGEAKAMARLDVLAVARDSRGRESAVRERVFRVERPPGGDEGLANLVLTLELDRTEYTIGVAIRDLSSGETAYISTSVDLAPEDDATSGEARGR